MQIANHCEAQHAVLKDSHFCRPAFCLAVELALQAEAAGAQVQALQPQAAVGVPATRIPLREAFAQVVRSEGLLSLWKGNGVTILHRLPYSAVNFWAYERSSELWNHLFPSAAWSLPVPVEVVRRFTAGAIAGLTACTLVGAFVFSPW